MVISKSIGHCTYRRRDANASGLASGRFETGGTTRLVVHDRYPSKEALDDAIASGSTSGMPESLEQLDELLVTLAASEGSRA